MGARTPTTVTSVYTPDRSRPIQTGTVIVRSTEAGGPRRPSVRTVTETPELTTSTDERDEGSASTRTAFRPQVLTSISPAYPSTTSRWPCWAGTVVSICWTSASAVRALLAREKSTVGPFSSRR